MQQANVAVPAISVGRERELDALRALFAEAATDGARLALLDGPRGVGKSRILLEFRSRVRLDGGVALEGRCEPHRAFGPFAEIIDGALRFLSEVGAGAGPYMADLACSAGCHRLWYQHGASLQPTTTRQRDEEAVATERRLRFFDAVHALLADVARVRAPVVLFHDVEHADLGTLQLIEYLLDARRGVETPAVDASPGMLFAASLPATRGNGLEDARFAWMRQHPLARLVGVAALDEAGVRALLSSPDFVRRILERTGGVPERIQLLVDADPLSPEERVRRRIRALPPVAAAMIDALAVLGRSATVETLEAMTGASATTVDRQALATSELLTRSIADGAMTLAFAREAERVRAYETLPVASRGALHTRAVDAMLGRQRDLEAAVRHALAAGDLVRAVPLALEAADSLAARHAHSEAAALLESVRDRLAPNVPAAVRERLADAYQIAGAYADALREARQLRLEAPARCAHAIREGELLTLAGSLEEAANCLDGARELAVASSDATAVAEVEALLAELHYQRAAYDLAEQWARRAESRAESLDDLALLLHARNTLGKLALAQREPAVAAVRFEENAVAAERAGLGQQHAQALTNLGVALLRTRQLAAAEKAFSRAIVVARACSDARKRAIATENLAVLAHMSRDYGTALEHYHSAVALLKRLGNRGMLARVANNLGELYLSLGDYARARALSDFAEHVAGSGVPNAVRAEGLLLRGRVDRATGRTTSAAEAFDAARAQFEKMSEARESEAWLELARVALVDGDIPTAERCVGKARHVDTSKREAERTLIELAIARAKGAPTLELAKTALTHAEASDDLEVLLPAVTELARSTAERGDQSTAVRLLSRARELDAALAARVPEAARACWPKREESVALASVESLIANARATASGGPASAAEARPSAPPPSSGKARSHPNLVGQSEAIARVHRVVERVAPTDALVLLRGESGTGKELVADAIHRLSTRRHRPFVKVNCAALVETLLLSELFGHEKGAFTGAQARKKGRFELADGGTIFLDEIGDISPKTQVALLRVLQEREFERVGGTQPIRVDVRIVAATHRDLEKMVAEGTFREDLYYRLRGVAIEMPALRDRAEDLPELCAHVLHRIARERDEAPKAVSSGALQLLKRHRWPGNVRELENVLRSVSLFADANVLEASDFSAFSTAFGQADPEPEVAMVPPPAAAEDLERLVYAKVRSGDVSLFDLKKNVERECITRALAETQGNITRAAALLGMKRPRLSQLVKEYGLQASGEA